jgi:hypothetical protein
MAIVLLVRTLAKAINKEIWKAFLNSKNGYKLYLQKSKVKKRKAKFQRLWSKLANQHYSKLLSKLKHIFKVPAKGLKTSKSEEMRMGKAAHSKP